MWEAYTTPNPRHFGLLLLSSLAYLPNSASTVVAFHRCERLPTTSSLPSLFARLTSDPTAIHHRHLYPPRFPPSQPTPIRSLPAFVARRVIQARPAATPGHGTIHFTRDGQSIRSFSLPSSLFHRRCHRPIESLSHVVREPAAYTRASPSRTPGGAASLPSPRTRHPISKQSCSAEMVVGRIEKTLVA
jgi:hypothetical protein